MFFLSNQSLAAKRVLTQHIQFGGTFLKMASGLRSRRQSVDHPLLFSEMLKELPMFAASFNKGTERNRD